MSKVPYVLVCVSIISTCVTHDKRESEKTFSKCGKWKWLKIFSDTRTWREENDMACVVYERQRGCYVCGRVVKVQNKPSYFTHTRKLIIQLDSLLYVSFSIKVIYIKLVRVDESSDVLLKYHQQSEHERLVFVL
jgi:hypothetical protein